MGLCSNHGDSSGILHHNIYGGGTMIKLSKTAKLDGISSWSTPAGTTCPNSGNSQVCKGCYAKHGNYRYDNVQAPRIHNMNVWKHQDFVMEFVKVLDNHRYFRWFDSGDIVSEEQARKIYLICLLTPWVKHWIPTRSHKDASIKPILEDMAYLPNVVVRYSSDAYNIDTTGHQGTRSVVITDINHATGFICTATETHGKCDGCRACWDKSVPEINYVIHGRVAVSQAKKLSLL